MKDAARGGPLAVLALGLLLTPPAHAAGAAAEATPAPAPPDEATRALAERLQAIEDRLAQVEDENAALREALRKPAPPRPVSSLSVLDGVKLRLGGFLDVGLFKAMGDGVAYVRDAGKEARPDLAAFPWVFLGDPWANPVNAQGDPADLGLDRTNLPRYDAVRSGGKLTFLINTANVGLVASLGEKLLAEVSLNLEPRPGSLGSTGDSLDVNLAYVEWRPFAGRDLHLFLGKFESTFGIEYRVRQAPDRFGVTPSLLCRYTCGTPIGVKVRGSFLSGLLTYNVAVTNGAMTTERFSELHSEVDRNYFKTVSGRLSLGRRLQRVPLAVEVGGSGMFGAQDGQGSETTYHWQAGADLKVQLLDFTLRAEYLRSVANEARGTETPWLHADGMYAEATYQALPYLGLLFRFDLRKALLYSPPNLYVSDVGRLTAALRFDIHFNVIAKVEYLHVRELSGPELDDDVITSSAILRF